jgi:hypothetical protein
MVKLPGFSSYWLYAIGYPRYIIFGIFGVIFASSVCFFHFFVFFGCIFFAFFMCLIMKIFGVHFPSIFCGLFLSRLPSR